LSAYLPILQVLPVHDNPRTVTIVPARIQRGFIITTGSNWEQLEAAANEKNR
jgi:hypothetical protein